MQIHDSLSLTGRIELAEIDAYTGVVLAKSITYNKVHTLARNACMAALDGGGDTYQVTHMALSTDDTQPAVGDTLLAGEVLREAIFQKTEPTPVSRQYKLVLGASEGNGDTYAKIGLFTAATDGVLIASGLFDVPKTKTDAKIFIITYTLSVGQA